MRCVHHISLTLSSKSSKFMDYQMQSTEREKSSLQFLKVMVVLFLGGACFLLLCVWRGVGMGVRRFLLIICFYDCEYCK